MHTEIIEEVLNRNDGRTDDALEELWTLAHAKQPGYERKEVVMAHDQLAAQRNEEVGFRRHVIIKSKKK